MPTKELDPRTGRYLVAFRLPPEAGAEHAWVAGDFNDWSTEALPMHREADGGMLAIVEDLEPGRELRFRYYLGDGRWENDWAADAYPDNEYGGADSLVSLPDVATPPATKAPSPEPTGPIAASSPIEDAASAAEVVEDAVKPAKKAAPKKATVKKAPSKKAAPVRPPEGTDTA